MTVSAFVCDWCGVESGVRIALAIKVEMFDPLTGQDLLRTRRELGFCSDQHRTNWIREP